jgi:ABC-2 type transport system ATP-binding protein
MSVRQNLLYHAALHGIGRRRAEVEIERVLAQVSLGDKRGERVGSLSIGQMRRIEIARALLHRPRLLLLDEATAGLDIRARAEILAHVRDLAACDGVGVLWATHLIDEVDAGDQVVVVHKGKVLAQGPVEAVTAAAQAADIRSAFARLTDTADECGGGS